MTDFKLHSYAPTHTLTIWMAGDFDEARKAARAFCERGACVAIERTTYVYTYGEETGIRVTVLNYPRFPKEPGDLWIHARQVARYLAHKLHQGSYSIEGPDQTEFYSRRESDV